MNQTLIEVERRIPTFWVEVFPVVRGLRSTGIIEVPDPHVSFFKEYLEREGLFFEMITALDFNKERARRGQDLLMNYIADNLFYIGDEMRKVRTLLECDFNNDFFCVGMMLGYPDCCVAAFFKRGTESVDIPKLKSLYPLITHVPCCETCGKSEEYSHRIQKDIDQFHREMAEGE